MSLENINCEILILAAGEARRFGSPKQLASFKGRSLLEHSVRLANDLGKKPYVTLGAHHKCIMENEALALCLGQNAQVIRVEEWQEGMSRSINAGISEVQSMDAGGVLILLADQPFLLKDDLLRLLSSVDGSKQIIGAEYDHGAGVPAYFSHHYFQDLRSLEGDLGARHVIRKYPHEIVEFGGRLVDIDTPEDLLNQPKLSQ